MNVSLPSSVDPNVAQLLAGKPLSFPALAANRQESREERAARTIPAKYLVDLASPHARKITVPITLENAIVIGDLDLSYATFEYELKLIGCEFTGGLVDFSFATFERTAKFSNSRFVNPGADTKSAVSFRGTHARADLCIDRCRFVFGVDFSDAHVEEVLDAAGSQFGEATFRRLEVAKSAYFSVDDQGNRTEFVDEVSFVGARIRGDAEFGGALFAKGAVFDDIVIEGDAYFCTEQPDGSSKGLSGPLGRLPHRISFGSETRFLGAHISGDAVFLGAEFRKKAAFDRLQVEGNAYFRPDEANNPVYFGAAARFPLAAFSAGVQFNGAHFKNSADFRNARFRAAAHFNLAQFEGEIDFTSAMAESDVQFLNATFRGPTSFREARFLVVFFADAPEGLGRTWWQTQNTLPGKTALGGKIDIRGFAYERIYIDLTSLFPRITPFDRQPYTQMENALRKAGADTLANRVYLERRRIERKRKFSRHLYPLWLADWFYKIVANYGVRPWWILFWAAAVLLIGAWLFTQPGALETKDTKRNAPPDAAGFLPALGVSFHQFLPVDVPVGDYWVPASRLVPLQVHLRTFRCTFSIFPSVYSTIALRIFGTLLQALLIGQITGFLRRAAP